MLPPPPLPPSSPARIHGLGSLHVIPDDVLLHLIFTSLSAKDLLTCSRCSKPMHILARDESLWKLLVLEKCKGEFLFKRSWFLTYFIPKDDPAEILAAREHDQLLRIRIECPGQEALLLLFFFIIFLTDCFLPQKINKKFQTEMESMFFYTKYLRSHMDLSGYECPDIGIARELCARASEEGAGLTKEEFRERYLRSSVPCVLQNAIDHWPARSWSIDWLNENASFLILFLFFLF
jgi:hypothetical protein